MDIHQITDCQRLRKDYGRALENFWGDINCDATYRTIKICQNSKNTHTQNSKNIFLCLLFFHKPNPSNSRCSSFHSIPHLSKYQHPEFLKPEILFFLISLTLLYKSIQSISPLSSSQFLNSCTSSHFH